MARRASPLSPEARRASIIAAAIPLLRLYGINVTTLQIAMAAGVAEGTLFRAFPDKEALIGAAMATAFDPNPTEAKLRAIDRSLDLRDQLIAAVEILQTRVEAVWSLMSMLRMTAPPTLPPKGTMPLPEHDAGIRAELTSIFETHRAELRCTPEYAMRIVRSMTFAGLHPRIIDTPFTAAEIVAIILDGIRLRPDEELS
jgi:AcrR family transcriptional regulator